MKVLRKTGVRILVCLFFGAVFQETLRIIFGKEIKGSFIIGAIISFILIEIIIKVANYFKVSRALKKSQIKKEHEDVIDNI